MACDWRRAWGETGADRPGKASSSKIALPSIALGGTRPIIDLSSAKERSAFLSCLLPRGAAAGWCGDLIGSPREHPFAGSLNRASVTYASCGLQSPGRLITVTDSLAIFCAKRS